MSSAGPELHSAIWAEEPLSVKVNHMIGVLSYPNLRLPRNMLHHLANSARVRKADT